jgi:aspartyl-tRNA(Asn)/glutamyl-tRNA(Gln) amidotransferase subunit A
LGAKVTAVNYLRAREFREKFKAVWHKTLITNELDAIVAPTTPMTATRIGEETVSIGGEARPIRALLLRLNQPANFVGVPAISVPCGLSREKLPVGLQLIGDWTEEAQLLEIGARLGCELAFQSRPDLKFAIGTSS